MRGSPSVGRQAQNIIYSRRFWNTSIWSIQVGASAEQLARTRLIGSNGSGYRCEKWACGSGRVKRAFDRVESF